MLETRLQIEDAAFMAPRFDLLDLRTILISNTKFEHSEHILGIAVIS
jgi:hypothetical protein